MVNKGPQHKHGSISGSIGGTKEWRVSCSPAHAANLYIDQVEWSILVANGPIKSIFDMLSDSDNQRFQRGTWPG